MLRGVTSRSRWLATMSAVCRNQNAESWFSTCPLQGMVVSTRSNADTPVAGYHQQPVVEIHDVAHLVGAHLGNPAGTANERVKPVARQSGECSPTAHNSS